jgi:formiminotetrahydrofolate cyclodeaminase
MLDQTIGSWLDDLASSAPAPGGGAGAAMNAAVGACLVAMVCNLTIGKPRYAAHEAVMTEALARATDLRAQAVQLADEDAAAFGAVAAAYHMPKATEAEIAARTEAIQGALAGAATVPLRIAAVAAEIIEVADRILEGANVNVISDIGVAAAAARAALAGAVLNVEVNLAAMKDENARRALHDKLGTFDGASAAADQLMAAVGERISR